MAATPDGGGLQSAAVSANSIALSLTTSKTNDVIIVQIGTRRNLTPHAVVSSISDSAALSWSKRAAVALDVDTFNNMEVWWAPSTGMLSGDIITVTLDRTADVIVARPFGVNGTSLSSPWDANVSLPAMGTGSSTSVPSVTLSTTSAGDMSIAFGYSGSLSNINVAGLIGGVSGVLLQSGSQASSVEYAQQIGTLS